MVSTIQRRLQHYDRYLTTAAVLVGLLLAEVVVGRRLWAFEPGFVAAAALSLLAAIAILWKLEMGMVLLGGLSMYGNPTIFDVQGRKIDVIHLVGGLIIVVWLLRRLVAQRDLRPPRSGLNAPLLALVTIWLVSWIAGYTFWDVRVPTANRPPLFFLAEFGQLLLFIGVFWAVADTVKGERWAKTICGTIIVLNASTVLRGGLGWNQTPVALALTCSLLAFGKLDLRVKAGLWLVLGIFLWGLIGVNRIPAYLASMAVVLAVSLFKSRRLFALMLITLAILGVAFINPLWDVEASVASRLELARLAWSIFKEYPVLGIGPTHYRSYAILYHRPLGWHTVESGILLPHDVWLYFLANMGVVGLLGILWVVGSMLWCAFSDYRRTQGVFSKVLAVSALACLAGVLVQSAGGHFGFLPDYSLSSFYMVPVWILMGLWVARGQGTIEEQDAGPLDHHRQLEHA